MWTFKPILKTTIWGGERIAPFKKIETDLHCIGESWEVSGVEGSESVVASAPDEGLTISQLIDKYGESLLGRNNFLRFGRHFPLLVKFIDAASDLSIQVHPDDEIARRHGGLNGKTEMWYVLDAAPDARLANGFKAPVDPEQYKRMVEDGSILDALNFMDVSKGEAFFIPARRVHAIGAGALIAEVQQTSDATYRIYDYGRLDADGNPRQLHTDSALETVNFEDTDGRAVDYTPQDDIPVNVVDSRFFTVNVLRVAADFIRDYSERDSFVILVAVEGAAMLKCGADEMRIEAGTSVLVAASERNVEIKPEGTLRLLETYIK